MLPAAACGAKEPTIEATTPAAALGSLEKVDETMMGWPPMAVTYNSPIRPTCRLPPTFLRRATDFSEWQWKTKEDDSWAVVMRTTTTTGGRLPSRRSRLSTRGRPVNSVNTVQLSEVCRNLQVPMWTVRAPWVCTCAEGTSSILRPQKLNKPNVFSC